ncbi:fibulin-2 isoform X2 [Salminus brasiliensis]|uniref:fibulin-2 isoform X2 n=1 Tax=Salminus brasiliensis TaxID=930266 RepID=UPI003B8390F1
MGLFKLLLLLCVSGCLCQKDCTGVDCPVLKNCIEEVLENGACCATCVQTGCTCEGYQFYDCVNAGFRKGRVPEGESYFVDFGSTECSCPKGGGRISCHFIPCPELPANCIDVSEPADGCSQCERIGCVYKEQKYEAGHSFHMDPCQVCHCPNDGGNLMCYPIPDCDPRKVQKPMLATTTEANPTGRHQNDPVRHIFNPQGSRASFSKPFPVSHRDNLPPFKLNPQESQIEEEEEDEEEEEEDYDYSTTDSLEPSLHELASPTEPSNISVSYPENVTPHQAIHRGTKQELRERLGFHEATTDRPWFPLHKDRTHEVALHKGNPEKDMLIISKDDSREAKLNTPEDSPNEENFPIYRETTYEEQFSIDRDTSERQSFGLYKDNTSEEPLEESNTDSEGLAAPTGTMVAEMFDLYEDTTYSEAVTDTPIVVDHTTPQLQETKTTTTLQPTSTGQNQSPTPEAREHYSTQVEEDIPRENRSEGTVMLSNVTDSNTNHGTESMDGKQEENTVIDSNIQDSTSASSVTSEKSSELHRIELETYTIPSVSFSPTSQPPLKVKADDGQPGITQSQSLFDFVEEAGEEKREERENTLSPFPKAHEGPSDPAQFKSCCESGQNWASENQHCNHLPTVTHHNSVCGVVQEQCCAGALRESRCLTGVNAAKAGEVCEESNSPLCGEDTQKECCSCCALGLRLRREGKGCDVHTHLSYPCGHIFLTCCEEEDEEAGVSTPVLRRKEKPKPTALPKRVAESQFPKQPFFIEDPEHAANSVEKLEDVDECQRHEGQFCHHICINTPGSYRCACNPGYSLLQDGHTCSPENAEEDNRVKEEDRPFTLATPLQETTAQIPPLNPCSGNSLCSQQCSVVRGKARCSCFPGFSLKVDGQSCEDLNECVTNAHTCLANERCVNTVGAYVCERQISCPSGYQLRNGVCEDIDECVLRSHNCGPGLQCQNTLGSFHCNPKQQRCLTGFTQDTHGNCIDIDECSVLSEPCTSGFNCINTVGSYTCQRKVMTCSRGFHSSHDGARCVDIDECAMGTHHCGEGQVCHNTPGSFHCDCQTGYQYDSTRRTCLDVNECWRFPGRLCAQSCENTPGSYQCSCTTGFSLAFDGKNCEDLNECDNNPCSQECANVYGSYQCYCRLGYYLKEDGHTCEDIDECSQSIGNLCAFQCVNIPGSYQCACPPQGYSMSPNGRTCRDIDECATGAHNCSASQTCYNVQGSFRCLSFTCPENYRKVTDTRCERASCPSFQDCQNMPLRITYYQLSFQTNIVIPAQIFRIGPSPAYSGDNIILSIPRGNEEGYFSTRRLNSFTGAVYLQRQIHGPRDFLIDVEMKLLRQGTFTSFLARIYVFITAHSM